MEQEIWKPIKRYEEYYEVSNFGRVKSLAKVWYSDNGRLIGRKKDTILKAGHRKNGYDFVVLCIGKIKKYASVHRLVAEHFCDNPNNHSIVNHLDCNIFNNRADNLEWTTYSGNAIHGFLFGNRKGMKGVKNPNTKIDEHAVIKIRELYKSDKYSQDELAKMFGVQQTQISRIVLRKRWNYI